MDCEHVLSAHQNISGQAQVSLTVRFLGEVVGNFVADVVVEKKVIFELKAVRELLPKHQAQVINYLNATGMEVGLLINFARPKLEYKRIYRSRTS